MVTMVFFLRRIENLNSFSAVMYFVATTRFLYGF